ncbi:unnamed protein product [Cylicostephanus goldi]|uniref:Eukaryotic peptide chain release factor subunit 1 n=1 Tax=Cylicostephanus goldi TaxID=71465 RepID=A0A3P6TPF7_CYLGO|nr:unnamed protein product [Cylicostephanus goldi]
MSAPPPVAGVEDSADRNVEMWKIKRLIKSLELARGNGTSMISLIIPPRDQIARVQKMLADEYGTASNIKSRVNRLSVLGAITSVQGRLKLYSKAEVFYLLLRVLTGITASHGLSSCYYMRVLPLSSEDFIDFREM